MEVSLETDDNSNSIVPADEKIAPKDLRRIQSLLQEIKILGKNSFPFTSRISDVCQYLDRTQPIREVQTPINSFFPLKEEAARKEEAAKKAKAEEAVKKRPKRKRIEKITFDPSIEIAIAREKKMRKIMNAKN